jgi:hypothetical protein
MDAIIEFMGSSTFWRILLFLHFVMAVGLLAAITLQTVATLMPLQQPAGAAGTFVERIRSAPPLWYVTAIVILYVPTFILGAWVYVKYRTYVRIPMEQIAHWKTVGSFEFKEHIVSMGMALLPAYWYFWRQPLAADHATMRKWVTLFLAVAVWYSFLVGHVANDFRGVGS